MTTETTTKENVAKLWTEAHVKLLGQHTYYGFLLKHGREWTITEDTFKGRRAKKHHCYQNAFTLLFTRPNLTYVEGQVVILGGIPVDHAWTVDQDGNVIDPTLDGKDVDSYFGVPFNEDYVFDTGIKTGVYGIISYTNPDLLTDNPDDIIAKGF